MLHKMAELFHSVDISQENVCEHSIEKVRALARNVKNFNEKVWEKNRYRIVEEGTYHKFAHSLAKDRDLRAALLGTGDNELILASPLDGI
jgi:ribA/ribD-fused uncharacterized protein